MKTNLKVYQANSFTESRQKFTLNEKRILATVIAQITAQDERFKKYEINMSKLAEDLEVVPQHLYKFAEEIIDSMIQKFVKIKDPEKEKIKAFPVFYRLEYENGTLAIQLHEDIQTMFLDLKTNKQFTVYELSEFYTLTSVYAQRIFELVKQYEKSKYAERTIPIDELRNMLGIDDGYYKLYADFKRRVLNVAHENINKNTNLRFEIEEKKTGRKITHIRFYDIRNLNGYYFLKSQMTFANFVREKLINKDLVRLKVNNNIYTLSVSEKGFLYYKEEPNIKVEKTMWKSLYDLCKKGEIKTIEDMMKL